MHVRKTRRDGFCSQVAEQKCFAGAARAWRSAPTTPTQADEARAQKRADITSVSRLGGLWNRRRRNSFTIRVRTGAGSCGMEDGVLKWTHGPSFEEGGIRFRLWAPKEERIALVIDGRDPVAMTIAKRTAFSRPS